MTTSEEELALTFIENCEPIWLKTLEQQGLSTEETTLYLKEQLATLQSTVQTWCRVGDELGQIAPENVNDLVPRLLIAGLCSAVLAAPCNPMPALLLIYLVREIMDFEEWQGSVVPGPELFLEICALQVLKLSRRGKYLREEVEKRGDKVLGEIMAGLDGASRRP